MATISISYPATASSRSSIPSLFTARSQNSPKVPIHSLLKSSTFFPSIKLRPINRTKPRLLTVVVSAAKKLSETELVSVPSEPDAISGIFPEDSGVYAVYDSSAELQFIGISRNIAASVLSHKNSLSELCSSVKFGVFDEPDGAALTQSWKSWVEEHIAATGKVPPGNESGNTTWIRQQPKKKADVTWVRQQPKKKANLRLTPGRHVQLTVSLENLIDRLVKEKKVVAFIKGSRTAPLCGFSQRVVAILETQGVDYESVDVLDEEYNNGLRETLKSYSNWPTFPQVFVNGELVGGCDILTSMYENGELTSLLKG